MWWRNRRQNALAGIVGAGFLGTLILAAAAGSAYEIVMVEEDWETQVGEPDTNSNGPQISMTMSPVNGLTDKYFVFTLNHRTEPNYVAGGMQVQVWQGESPLSNRNGPNVVQLHHDNETVSWTQRLSIDSGVLTFEIRNGASESWGSFGGQGYLKDTVATTASNLNQYRPYTSLVQSGVAYAGNRVKSLQLQRIRWTLSNGQVYQVVAPIDIDFDLDP